MDRDSPSSLEARFARWLTPRRARVYAATVVALVLGGWLVSQLVGPGLADASGTIVGADFSALWIGGHLVAEGRTSELYDPDVQRAALDALLAPAPNDAVCPFVNPPWAALALAPLGMLPYPLALALWWALAIGALVASAALVRRELDPRRSLARTLWLGLAFFPTLACLTYGQSSTLSMLAWLAMALDLRRGRDLRAGFWLGLLAWKPQLGLGPAVMLLAAGRTRALGGAALGAALWVVLGLALAPEAVVSWLRDAPALFELIRSDGYRSWGLVSSFGLGALLLDPLSPLAGAVLGHTLTGLTLAAIALVVRRGAPIAATEAGDRTLAAALALAVIASPHLYVYDATLLLVPLALVLARCHSREGELMDGGPLLARTGLLWIVLFAGPYLTLAVQGALGDLGLPPVALQLPTLAIAAWASRVRTPSAAMAAV